MIFIRWLSSLILIALAVPLALGNLEPVLVTWSPLHDPIGIPLAFLCLSIFIVGFLIGAFFVWLQTGWLSPKTRAHAREMRHLRKTLAQNQS